METIEFSPAFLMEMYAKKLAEKEPKKNSLKNKRKNAVKEKKEKKKVLYDFVIDLDETTLDFIEFFYDNFENLIEIYGTNTVKIYLVSLIAYLNNGIISRKRIYEFVNKFDKSEKIRKLTWGTFTPGENRKYEDWHHVGGALSYIVSKYFNKTEFVEENEETDREIEGNIYEITETLNNYVERVIYNFIDNNTIILD